MAERIRRAAGSWAGPRSWALLAAAFAALILAGRGAAAGSAEVHPITVFAAASTTDVLQRLGRQFEQGGGAPVRFSFASSSLLARQIEEGAPADVFVSADEQWMDYLQQRSLIRAGTRRDLLANVLVLVAPKGRLFSVKMERGFNLPGAFKGRLAVGDPTHVPAGIYAKEALQHFGWWEALKGRLDSAENVRAALRLVEMGEADAGIVYATDARASSKVVVLAEFPPGSHAPIVYPAALCRGARPGAAAFLAFLGSREAAPVWHEAGFRLTD